MRPASPERLRDLFVAHVPEPARTRFAAIDDRGAALHALVIAARAEAPEVALDDEALVIALAARVPAEADDASAALGALAAGDVLLAEGCARGDPGALRAFERRFAADLDVAIAKSPNLAVGRDDFHQLVREHLFVAADGRAPRIAGYAGRGPLRAWIRVATTRLIIDLARKPAQPEARPADELDALLPAASDAEAAYLRHAYGAHLAAAFAEALAQLTVRQRNLLRQKFVHELTGERLAAMYGVHRATVFGWIEGARKALLVHLGAALRARTAGHDLDSVVGLVGSRLDVSVRRLLDSRLEDDPR